MTRFAEVCCTNLFLYQCRMRIPSWITDCVNEDHARSSRSKRHSINTGCLFVNWGTAGTGRDWRFLLTPCGFCYAQSTSFVFSNVTFRTSVNQSAAIGLQSPSLFDLFKFTWNSCAHFKYWKTSSRVRMPLLLLLLFDSTKCASHGELWILDVHRWGSVVWRDHWLNYVVEINFLHPLLLERLGADYLRGQSEDITDMSK